MLYRGDGMWKGSRTAAMTGRLIVPNGQSRSYLGGGIFLAIQPSGW